MSRVVHFEVHATEPEKLVTFYGDLLGWQFAKWDGPMEYWMIKTGPTEHPGIDGGMVRRMGSNEGQAVLAFVCTVAVQAIDAAVARATELGGSIALPKMPVPGVGWLAYVKDPDGNMFGLMQSDTNAA